MIDKKIYILPELEISYLDNKDAIATSGGSIIDPDELPEIVV